MLQNRKAKITATVLAISLIFLAAFVFALWPQIVNNHYKNKLLKNPILALEYAALPQDDVRLRALVHSLSVQPVHDTICNTYLQLIDEVFTFSREKATAVGKLTEGTTDQITIVEKAAPNGLSLFLKEGDTPVLSILHAQNRLLLGLHRVLLKLPATPPIDLARPKNIFHIERRSITIRGREGNALGP